MGSGQRDAPCVSSSAGNGPYAHHCRAVFSRRRGRFFNQPVFCRWLSFGTCCFLPQWYFPLVWIISQHCTTFLRRSAAPSCSAGIRPDTTLRRSSDTLRTCRYSFRQNIADQSLIARCDGDALSTSWFSAVGCLLAPAASPCDGGSLFV